MLINENNPLFEDKKKSHFSTLTGGCQLNKSPLQTVKDEIFEETGININDLTKDYIYSLGSLLY